MQTLAKHLEGMPPIKDAWGIKVETTKVSVEATVYWISEEPFDQEPIDTVDIQLDWSVVKRLTNKKSHNAYFASLEVGYRRKKDVEAEQNALIKEALQLKREIFPQR